MNVLQLTGDGSDHHAMDDVIEHISATMTRNRLMTRRRVIAHIAMADIAPALEITHLDVLDVVQRLDGKSEATIGAVAKGMRIDPSRASRIVSELVAQNVLERRICQSDARCSILVITPQGRSLLNEVHAAKRKLLNTVTQSWDREDLELFSGLYERFTNGLEDYAREFSEQRGDGRED